MKQAKNDPIGVEFFAALDTLKMSISSGLHASLSPADCRILLNGVHYLVNAYQVHINEKPSIKVEAFFEELGIFWNQLTAPSKRRKRG
jgi:hypothetical protein